MTVDWDGQIRMDPVLVLRHAEADRPQGRFDIAFACDTDHDRHGIVTPERGLLPPNHYLASPSTTCSSIDRNGALMRRSARRGQQPDDRSRHGEARAEALRGAGRLQVVRRRPARRLAWLRRGRERGRVLPPPGWQRLDDRQGRHRPGLLAAEITARMGRDPGEIYRELAREFGEPVYDR
jgi:phosphoglucomutase